MRLLCLVFLLFVSMESSGKTLVVAGTGDNQNLLRLLAKEFEKLSPDVSVNIPDSIGSTGGIKAVATGRVDLGRTARPVKPSEPSGLIVYRFAISPVVFVAHKSAEGVNNISTSQILDIYSGRITNWKDIGGPRHRLYAVDREKGDSSRSVLEKKLKGFSDIDSSAKVFFNTPDTVAALSQNDYTFGFLPMSEVIRAQLKALSIDEIAPGSNNITTGKYPYSTEFYLVSKGEATGLDKQFIDFIRSSKAHDISRRFGVIPVQN